MSAHAEFRESLSQGAAVGLLQITVLIKDEKKAEQQRILIKSNCLL